MDKHSPFTIDSVQTALTSKKIMKLHQCTKGTASRFYGWFAMALWACQPSMAFSATVGIDQSPLVVQKPLPPNIVLMLDDSGPMGWPNMPDKTYITDYKTSNSLINSAHNGVYYDPAVTYSPPPTANTINNYPPYTDLTFVPEDGFNPSSYDSYNLGVLTSYTSGTSNSQQATLNMAKYTQLSSTYNVVIPNVTSSYQCKSDSINPNYKSKSYSASASTCTLTYYKFSGGVKYATGNTGNYTVHYIAPFDCTGYSNCVLATDVSGAAAPKGIAAGTNVANWFAYYHTRILAAKSGLMNAFSDLNDKYRVGYGSIDGNNDGSAVPNPYKSIGTVNLNPVAAFGDGTSTSDQKYYLWQWLVGESAGGGTPLRSALDSVGQYYETAQPWESDDAGSPLSCRQSYTILTTDGFWNGNAPTLGDSSGSDNDSDYLDGPVFKDASGVNQGYVPKAPYEQQSDNAPTLADVAMHYWKTDLRTTLDNDVPVTPNDPAFWQHMTTFTVGLGFDPVGIEPSGTTVSDIFGWADSGGSVPTDFAWPTPKSDSKYNVADLAHAGLNGHGGFFSAKNPKAFEQGIASALAATSARLGAGNASAVDSSTLTAGSSLSFTATYYTSQWTGQLVAKQADASGSYTVPYWDAAAELPSYDKRNIKTTTLVKQGNSNTATAIAFTAANASKFPASLADAGIANTTVPVASMINYLSGDTEYDTTNPGGTLRARKSLIGDIVHSSPIYVPAPSATAFSGRTFDGSQYYSQFVTDNVGREPVVFVAANDGMLHAFAVNAFTDSNTGISYSAGQELYAFLPGALLRQTGDASIGRLANPQYGIANKADGTETVPHQYYNDGELTVANAYINKSWHTVLVGTTGLGQARAVYALDVTDPSGITLLWERAADDGDTNSDYIGQMTGKPIIAEVPNGNNQSEWVVLMGNGANSANGTAGLLQFDLETGDLKVYDTDKAATSNALAAPAVWQASSADNLSTDAYAGDLLGNVWHFTLSGGTSNGSGSPVYVAKDANSKLQPITAGMAVAYNPNDGSRWIFFGTGKYQTAGDVNTSDPQTWYGLRVYSATTSALTVTNLMDRTNLMQRTIVAQQQTANGSISRATSTATATENMQTKAGWYLDLAYPAGTTNGERIINPSQIIGGYLFVSTLIPSAANLCNPYPRGAIMAVDPFTGANPGVPIQDTNGDGKIDAGDAVDGVFFNSKLLDVALGGMLTAQTTPSGITISGVDLKGNPTGGNTNPNPGAFSRLSWREILNQ